jgi:hypothetical protein
MKGLALLLVTVPLLGATSVTLLILLLLTFPWENSDPVPDSQVALAVAATGLGLLLPAVLTWIGVATDRTRLTDRAFAAHALVALALVLYAVSASDHGDGTILLFAVPIEICGFLGVLVASRDVQPVST